MNFTKSLVILSFTLLGHNFSVSGQLAEISLDSCIKESDFIFEGTVISETGFTPPDSSWLYFSDIVKVSKVLKGNIQCGTVEIINEASSWRNGDISDVPGGCNLGDQGIFMCTKETFWPYLTPPTENPYPLNMYYGRDHFTSYLINGNDTTIQSLDFKTSLAAFNYIQKKLAGNPKTVPLVIN